MPVDLLKRLARPKVARHHFLLKFILHTMTDNWSIYQVNYFAHILTASAAANDGGDSWVTTTTTRRRWPHISWVRRDKGGHTRTKVRLYFLFSLFYLLIMITTADAAPFGVPTGFEHEETPIVCVSSCSMPSHTLRA